jgi:hypothetical protein
VVRCDLFIEAVQTQEDIHRLEVVNKPYYTS